MGVRVHLRFLFEPRHESACPLQVMSKSSTRKNKRRPLPGVASSGLIKEDARARPTGGGRARPFHPYQNLTKVVVSWKRLEAGRTATGTATALGSTSRFKGPSLMTFSSARSARRCDDHVQGRGCRSSAELHTGHQARHRSLGRVSPCLRSGRVGGRILVARCRVFRPSANIAPFRRRRLVPSGTAAAEAHA